MKLSNSAIIDVQKEELGNNFPTQNFPSSSSFQVGNSNYAFQLHACYMPDSLVLSTW